MWGVWECWVSPASCLARPPRLCSRLTTSMPPVGISWCHALLPTAPTRTSLDSLKCPTDTLFKAQRVTSRGGLPQLHAWLLCALLTTRPAGTPLGSPYSTSQTRREVAISPGATPPAAPGCSSALLITRSSTMKPLFPVSRFFKL